MANPESEPIPTSARPESVASLAEIPPSLATALNAPPVPPKSWQDGVGPAFIALGLGVVFLDRLAPTTLMVGGLGPSIVGAVLGGLLAYWCLYYAPAIWGFRTGRPLGVVASSTFGARGAVIVPGLLLGVASVVWFALTIDYAAQYAMGGMASLGLLDPRHLAVRRFGAMNVPMPVFLAVAGSWTIASAVIGTLAIRLVTAVMATYVVFPALVIGAAVVWAMPGLASGPIETAPLLVGGGRSLAAMIQLMFAFLACQGLMAVDWGAATKAEGDVRKGGIAGIMFAMPVLAILALLIVAGAIGRSVAREEQVRSVEPLGSGARPAFARRTPTAENAPPDGTLRDVLARGIGGRLGGAAILVLSLGLLGPACSHPFVIARQFSALWPRVPRWAWSILGAIATWPLIAAGMTRDVEGMFGLIGGLVAPAVGAIAADYARTRGQWPGPRRGLNGAGFAAWVVGIGTAFAVARWGNLLLATRFLPSSIAGFAGAFLVYQILATVGLEPKPLAASGGVSFNRSDIRGDTAV